MTFWTTERTNKAIEMANDGHSGAEIARAIGHGATRGSVLGKLWRMGIPIKQRTNETPEAYEARLMKQKAYINKQPVIQERCVAIPITDGKPFRDLERGECQWMDGDPKKGAFACSAAVLPGYPYCEAHCRRAYINQKLHIKDKLEDMRPVYDAVEALEGAVSQ